MCHIAYANILQYAYDEVQSLLEVDSSATLDLFGCNQIILCLQPISFIQRWYSAPFPPVSIDIKYPINYITVGGMWHDHHRNVYLKQIILSMIEQN